MIVADNLNRFGDGRCVDFLYTAGIVCHLERSSKARCERDGSFASVIVQVTRVKLRRLFTGRIDNGDGLTLSIFHGDISTGSFQHDVRAVQARAGYRHAVEFDFVSACHVILNQIVAAGINVDVSATAETDGIVAGAARNCVSVLSAFKRVRRRCSDDRDTM